MSLLERDSISKEGIHLCQSYSLTHVCENSRTLVLAKHILGKMPGEVIEVNLNQENILPLNRERLEKREGLISREDRNDPMFSYAKQFAEAEEIVIAAPFWDLSFPAILKAYMEQITVSRITFEYINGRPYGLCKAKRLTYITTSGGPIFADFGYEYIKTLAKSFYGISETKAYRAMNLDVNMIAAEDVLTKADITVIE